MIDRGGLAHRSAEGAKVGGFRLQAEGCCGADDFKNHRPFGLYDVARGVRRTVGPSGRVDGPRTLDPEVPAWKQMLQGAQPIVPLRDKSLVREELVDRNCASESMGQADASG